jgi:short-subunit dehydrogenase
MGTGLSIQNKTIVITGASSGVGKAMALELAKYHPKLVLAARRLEALNDVADECRALGAEALAVETDIRSVESIQLLAQAAIEFGDSIDVWINNAGVLAAGRLEEIPAEVNEDVIRINLLGYLHSAHVVLPYFKMQHHGILINNISVGAWFPTPYGTAYTASKFGLQGFAEALKGELEGWKDIQVCNLYPGFLDTPGIQHAANYTGKYLKPAPPVMDPYRVARAVVRIIQSPKPNKTIGLSPALLKLSWALFPGLTRSITVKIIRSYLNKADALPPTSGNVLQPVGYGTSVEGGWKKPVKRSVKLAFAAGVVCAAGLLMLASGAGRK